MAIKLKLECSRLDENWIKNIDIHLALVEYFRVPWYANPCVKFKKNKINNVFLLLIYCIVIYWMKTLVWVIVISKLNKLFFFFEIKLIIIKYCFNK